MSGGYRKKGEVKRGSGRGLTGFAWEGVEASEAGLEKEADAIARAVALFGNIEFAGDAPNVGRDWAGVRRLRWGDYSQIRRRPIRG